MFMKFTVSGLNNCDEENDVFLHCIVISKISQCSESSGQPCLTSLDCL